MVYKNIINQQLKEKFNDRAIKNVEKMEVIEKKMEEIVSKLDFDELENQESKENLPTYTCTVTMGIYLNLYIQYLFLSYNV